MTDFEYVNAITLSLIVDFDSLLGEVTYKPYYICHVRATQDYTPLSSGEVCTFRNPLRSPANIHLLVATAQRGCGAGDYHGQERLVVWRIERAGWQVPHPLLHVP